LFIKASIRGGYRAAAKYLSEKGKNEVSRVVHISDPDANNLDEAFRNMWETASVTKAEKPLFHFSINPFKDERLTDLQAKRIAQAYALKCNMDIAQHQHVIVEHVLDGRQHFHVFLNRVNQNTEKTIDPGLYKKKAKECAREMEIELHLKRLVPSDKKKGDGLAPQRIKRTRTSVMRGGTLSKVSGPSNWVNKSKRSILLTPSHVLVNSKLPRPTFQPAMWMVTHRRTKDENIPDSEKPRVRRPEDEALEVLIWAWENKRPDILRDFGIILPPNYEF